MDRYVGRYVDRYNYEDNDNLDNNEEFDDLDDLINDSLINSVMRLRISIENHILNNNQNNVINNNQNNVINNTTLGQYNRNIPNLYISSYITSFTSNGYDMFNYDNLEDVKVTLTENEFNNLSKRIIINNDDTLINKQCHICLEDFMISDNITELKCKHEYHTECIKSWVMSQSIKCPICRTPCK